MKTVEKTGGYCWRTPQCRNLPIQHAFFEGQKAREMCARKGTSRTLKEIRQQYPGVNRVPERNSANHLIRLEEERRGDEQAESFGGLQIDDQLEFRGLRHRQVGRLGAFQDSSHIGGG